MVPLLRGIRLIDLTAVILGPYATQILGDLGAEVIKIEPPDGDSMRAIPPVAAPGMSALFANNNRNKRSLVLDLKSDRDKAILRQLVTTADALVHNMRQEAMDRLGFGVAAVRELNPRLVYCAAVGFGSNGPYAGRPAYDDVIQAMSGYAGLSELRDGEPALAPSIIADKVVGLHVVHAVLAALLHRERNPGSAVVTIEVPMFEAMTAFTMNEHLAEATFEPEGRYGYARALARQRRPFRTADGWIAVLPYNEGHWRAALRAIGDDELASADWLREPATRNVRAPQLYARLEAALACNTSAVWLATFESIDVPCGPAHAPGALAADPHLEAVGLFKPRFAEAAPIVRTLNQAIRFANIAQVPDAPPPPLGGSNADVEDLLGTPVHARES